MEILDTNDNSPFFHSSGLTFELSESAEPGTSFFVPSADDLDSPKNGVKQYSIEPHTDSFELLVRDRPDGTRLVRLSLRRRLDRETRDFYRFNIVALDGGDPTRSALLPVNVTVLDSNDNPPEFDNLTYEVRLKEDIEVGTVVFRMNARDPDQGLNGEIVYGFTKETAMEYGHVFDVDSSTGRIFTKEELDFETQSVFMLYVVANDRGTEESLSSQALVIVKVEDVNDNPPKIRINALSNNNANHFPQVIQSLLYHGS